MNIYVGNISHQLTEDELREAFEAYGAVDKASIIKDKFTGDSRGFGFVEMSNSDEAQTAITELNGKELKGRTLNVSEARPRPEGGRRGGPGGNGGSRGGFGSGPRRSSNGGGGFGSSGGRGRF